MGRKDHSYKGKTVFKRKYRKNKLFTPLNIYKEYRKRKFRDDPKHIDMFAIFQEFYVIPTKRQRVF